MKTKTLEEQVRESAHINRGLVLPTGQRTYRSWPLCLTCFKEVDAVDLKDVSNKGCEIVAKCTHKKNATDSDPVFEDYYKVTWTVPVQSVGNNPLDDPNVGWAIKRAMHDFSPFNPKHQFDFTSKR